MPRLLDLALGPDIIRESNRDRRNFDENKRRSDRDFAESKRRTDATIANQQISQRQRDRQLDIAADRLGLSREEMGLRILDESIDEAPDAESAIQLAELYGGGTPLPDAIKEQIRALPADQFGRGFSDTSRYGTSHAAFEKELKALPDDEARQKAREIRAGIRPRAVGSANITIAGNEATGEGPQAEDVADVSATIKGAEESAKGQAGRLGDAITEGLVAADSLPTTFRALSLLESGVETGRIPATQLAFLQSLGIEDPEAGELSNLMGKAVLKQLRSTFGAAFTAEEGRSLAQIEASFGRNPETNKRLLRNALNTSIRAAKRGLKAAERDGDEFAAEELRAALSAVEPGGDLPEGVTEEDIQETMRANDMAREEVIAEIKRRGG